MRTLTRSPLWAYVLAPLLLQPASSSAQALGDHQYTTSDIEAGSRVYTTECALCHGANGDEEDAVNLRLGQFRRVQSDDDLRRVITEGIGSGRMPAFELRPAELQGIVAFIRAGFDPSGVAVRVGDADAGQALFEGEAGCARCHRVQGRGPRTAPDLSEIGAIRSPAALQRALLDPNAALLPINRPVRAVTRDGRTIRGRRLNEDTYSVQLIDSEERLTSLLKSDLVEYEVSPTSAKAPTPLSADQVADVVGYLLSLRGIR